MKRRELIETLEELLLDEFDSSELVYLTKKELIHVLIYRAEYYRDTIGELISEKLK